MLSISFKDAIYIFSVAMRNEPTEATFNINSGSSVEVISEKRTIEITNGRFKDHFDGYDVHIYKISEGDTTR